MLQLGSIFPDFFARTTRGDFQFHKYIGGTWCVFFSHPSDFTPVCTTELARVLQLLPEFTKRNTKVIGLSCDNIGSHIVWIDDIKAYAGNKDRTYFPFPIIEDSNYEVASLLGMIDKDESAKAGKPLTARAVFIIDPNRKLRLSILYPATTGRNFEEILRVLDSMQLTDEKMVATPADWKMGSECMVLPTVPDEEVAERFPQGVRTVPLPSRKNYMRFTPCPEP